MVLITELVGGALLGTACGGVLDAIVDATNKTTSFQPNLEGMESTLGSIIPIMMQIAELNKGLDVPEEETAMVMEKLKKGKELVIKYSKVRWWQVWKKASYAKKLDNFEKSLFRLSIVMQAQQSRDLKKNSLEVKDLRTDFMSMNKNIDGERNELVEPPQYTIGLDMPFLKLKMDLLKNGTSVIVLTAPPGYGKTTLAKMLCRDQLVQGKFKDNIFFVDIYKTPNLKVIVQSIFCKCNKVHDQFLNDEDAINQLEQLLRQIEPNPILLVLDDVWYDSEDLIDKFKFQLSDYKILVTTRIEFPRFDSPHHLKPLDIEQATTLFRYSALVQGGSFDFQDENFVEFVRFCEGCPLLLKKIAKFFCRIPPSRLKDAISRNEAISNRQDLLSILKKAFSVSINISILNDLNEAISRQDEDGFKLSLSILNDLNDSIMKILNEAISSRQDEDGLKLCVSILNDLNNEDGFKLFLSVLNDMNSKNDLNSKNDKANSSRQDEDDFQLFLSILNDLNSKNDKAVSSRRMIKLFLADRMKMISSYSFHSE